MYLSNLSIEGYKVFDAKFNIKFKKGLTVLIGENGSGKTAIIDSLRLLLNEDEYGRVGISETHFHRPISEPANAGGADEVIVKGTFSELKEQEQIAFLPWLDAGDNTIAYLNKKIDNKENNRGRFEYLTWGGESISGIFEWELLNALSCIYLPPLRDAESKLEAYRGSRLSRLFRKEKPKKGDPKHKIEDEFEKFNSELLKDPTIKAVNTAIKKYLNDSLGSVLGQDAIIQFAEVKFDRIVEKLRLLFYPKIDASTKVEFFREISENSLGYNNILYLATVLAELDGLEVESTKHKILLIEEPEAHLHPQLQIKLVQYLQKQAASHDIQIILTTHSSTITASSGLNTLNVLTINEKGTPSSTLVADCKIQNEKLFFLERWLDITKSTMFFSKGILFVEGISEALLLKELAKIVIKKHLSTSTQITTLEDFGITIVNLNGIYFKHFMQIFQGYQIEDDGTVVNDHPSIPIRCAGITDCDPETSKKPISTSKCACKNSQYYLIKELEANSKNCRMYSNLKTLEYDMCLIDENIKVLIQIYDDWLDTEGATKKKLKLWLAKNWSTETEEAKADVAFELLNFITTIKNKKGSKLGKGLFAQKIAYKLGTETSLIFNVPSYIEQAILWVTNIKAKADA